MRVYLSLAVLAALAAVPTHCAAKPAGPDPQIHNACWIWLEGYEDAENTAVYFRKTFSLTGPPRAAVLQISADNEYKIWLNRHQGRRDLARCRPVRRSRPAQAR